MAAGGGARIPNGKLGPQKRFCKKRQKNDKNGKKKTAKKTAIVGKNGWERPQGNAKPKIARANIKQTANCCSLSHCPKLSQLFWKRSIDVFNPAKLLHSVMKLFTPCRKNVLSKLEEKGPNSRKMGFKKGSKRVQKHKRNHGKSKKNGKFCKKKTAKTANFEKHENGKKKGKNGKLPFSPS